MKKNDSNFPVVLCILDGFGLSDEIKHNAIAQASTKNISFLSKNYPYTKLQASGEAVGLPAGNMGNSEVGHITIGSGRVIPQFLLHFQQMASSGELKKSPVLRNFIKKIQKQNGIAHVAGLMSDGKVHSFIDNALYIVKILLENNIKVCIHFISDGRDTPPSSAMVYINQIKTIFNTEISNNSLFFGTISGRYYAMDRNQNWDRTKLYYDTLFGKSDNIYSSIEQVIDASYKNNITDEFILPAKISNFSGIKDNDGFLFINYRADRARQIISALGDSEFNGFNRGKNKPLKNMISFASYSKESNKYCPALILKKKVNHTLGKVLSDNKISQLRISETEKYNHVTYFFDAEKMVTRTGMKKILIPSPDVKTFDLKPEMSAIEITDIVLKELDNFKVIIINYANGDMVGHTGNETATISAISCLDKCIGRLYPEILKRKGALLITADHGNAEEMWNYEYNVPWTAHTTNLVPFILVSDYYKKFKLVQSGGLSDIAPTLLDILNISKPKDMTGKSLIIGSNKTK